MPQSFASVYLHWVFSTKERYPYFSAREKRAELFSVLGGKCKSLDCNPVVVGGVEDHVHLLTTFGRKLSIAETVKEIKRGSNQWIQDELGIGGFKWQSGYGVFSVSLSQLDIVSQYIENQEQHHTSRDFQDEFRALLKRHKVDWDERYVWD